MTEHAMVTLAVLLAAFLHAAWNSLVKTGADRIATFALIGTVWLFVGGLGVMLLPAPAPASWPYVAASMALHNLYVLGMLWMYREGDLSHVYPLARGSAPLMLAFLAGPIVGEQLRPQEWLGVATILAGVLILSIPRGLEAGLATRRHRRATIAALVVGAFIVTFTLTDALGVRLTPKPLPYIVWLFFTCGIPWVLVLAVLRLRQPARLPKALVLSGLGAGLCSMLAYSLVIWALSLAPVAPIAALRETSVVFAALIGALLLGEPFGARRIAASVLVATGIALLNL